MAMSMKTQLKEECRRVQSMIGEHQFHMQSSHVDLLLRGYLAVVAKRLNDVVPSVSLGERCPSLCMQYYKLGDRRWKDQVPKFKGEKFNQIEVHLPLEYRVSTCSAIL